MANARNVSFQFLHVGKLAFTNSFDVNKTSVFHSPTYAAPMKDEILIAD